MKNIAIFVLSPFHDNGGIHFTSDGGQFDEYTTQTNEAPLKYMDWRLKRDEGEKLDKAYALVTNDLEDDGTFEKFRAIFSDIDIEKIPLGSGNMEEAIKNIARVQDYVTSYQKENPGDIVRVNVDFTGGFRRDSMMLLVIIQMLRYLGVELGMVIYGKLSFRTHTGSIEDATELMDVFSLIGGAEEFSAFGLTNQLRNYFADRRQPKRLITFLGSMENVSEAIKVNSNYDSMVEALRELKNEITSYELAIGDADDLSGQELLFSKLLPHIKEEYRDILPSDEGAPREPDIIRWCVRKSFLTQAVTLFTEWMPHYLLKSGKVTVNNPNVILDCQNNGLMWSNWENHLFRNYIPGLGDDDPFAITYGNLVPMLQTGNLFGLKNMIGDKLPKLSVFLNEAANFAMNTETSCFTQDVNDLPDDDMIKIVLKKSMPSTADFDTYLDSRITKEGDVLRVIIKAMSSIPGEAMNELFGVSAKALPSNVSKENKAATRRKAMSIMLENGDIETTLPPENLISFAEQYTSIVGKIRNRLSHAGTRHSSRSSTERIGDAILESLDLVDGTQARQEA